jgi:predicted MPP superfamily phosphohydrolase
MRITRRHAITVGLGLAAAGVGIDAVVIEPHWLDVTYHDVAVPDLPRALHGFTIVQITDAHLKGDEAWLAIIAKAVRRAKPQLVVMTGDAIERASELPRLREFGAALGAAGAPLVGIPGNWEHWGGIPLSTLGRAYAKFSGRLLVNEALVQGGVTLLGTDDDLAGSVALAPLARVTGTPRILLTHSPRLLDAASLLGPVHLALAGHTHGGQARLGSRAPFCPPGSGRFVAGFYDTPIGPAYVARGLGLSVVPARLLCRPELPVFRLVRP